MCRLDARPACGERAMQSTGTTAHLQCAGQHTVARDTAIDARIHRCTHRIDIGIRLSSRTPCGFVATHHLGNRQRLAFADCE
jgi:hypothetical protein